MSVVDRIAAQAAADVIKNETTTAANTATRVGGLLRDIADSAAIGSVVPVTISADQNNWAPTDFDKAKDGALRVSTNDGTQRNISGIIAKAHGFRFWLLNRGTGNIVLLASSGLSLPANQIVAGVASTAYVQPLVGAVLLEYDATMSRWCVLSFQHMKGTASPLAIASSAAVGSSARWADADHRHALPVSTGLFWNGANLEAQGEPAPTNSTTLATADATITTALTLALADNTVYDVKVRLIGRADTNALILQDVTVRYSRKSAGAPVQSGTPEVPATNSVGTGVGYVIDTSSNDLRIRVQGQAATDINWDVRAWVKATPLPAQPA